MAEREAWLMVVFEGRCEEVGVCISMADGEFFMYGICVNGVFDTDYSFRRMKP